MGKLKLSGNDNNIVSSVLDGIINIKGVDTIADYGEYKCFKI